MPSPRCAHPGQVGTSAPGTSISKRSVGESARALQPSLLKPHDAAALLNVSARSLWSLYNRGEIPVVRIGKAVRFDPADLERWIADRKTGGRP